MPATDESIKSYQIKIISKYGRLIYDEVFRRLDVGDVKMKKPHPCGSQEWEILRVGADFRFKCMGWGIRLWCQENWLKKIQDKLQKRLETTNFLW